MNIYTQKQNWKIALGAAAIVIVIASLAYTNYLIKQIANDERSKIKIWAGAIQKKARLVKYTNELFDKIKSEERKRVEIWAQASKMLTISESSADLNFYLNVLDNNATIPVILADDQGNITSWKNIDSVENKTYSNLSELQKNRLLAELQKMRTQKDSILIPLTANTNNVIFYSESKLFNELRYTLDDLIKSFITEVVNNYASVPVLITDGVQRNVIASGNIAKQEINSFEETNKLIRKMSRENLPIEIDLGAGEKNYIFYQDKIPMFTCRNLDISLLRIIY
jgi:hypothetical protein